MNEIKVGTYTGAGAAINIELGFVPGALFIFNITDGTNFTVWFPALAAAAGISVVTTAGPVLDTTNQVTAYNGDATHAPGFTVGTDLATNAKVYQYIALRTQGPRTQPSGAGAGVTGTSA